MTELTVGLVCACLPSINILRERFRRRCPRTLQRRAALRPLVTARFPKGPHAPGSDHTRIAIRDRRFAWPSPNSHAELAILSAGSTSDGGHTRPCTAISTEMPGLWRLESTLDAGEINTYSIRATMAMPVEITQCDLCGPGDDANVRADPHQPWRDECA